MVFNKDSLKEFFKVVFFVYLCFFLYIFIDIVSSLGSDNITVVFTFSDLLAYMIIYSPNIIFIYIYKWYRKNYMKYIDKSTYFLIILSLFIILPLIISFLTLNHIIGKIQLLFPVYLASLIGFPFFFYVIYDLLKSFIKNIRNKDKEKFTAEKLSRVLSFILMLLGIGSIVFLYVFIPFL